MPIRYPCFISYAHGTGGVLIPSFMSALVTALQAEFSAYFREQLWIDRDKLKPGDALDTSLRQAICESVCVIVVFFPIYNESEHCMRELSAALELEEQRLAKLKEHVPRDKRLVMTILLRGDKEDLPAELQHEERIFADFSSFTMYDTNLANNDAHVQKIREMAKSIYQRFKEMRRATEQGIDVCGDCDALRFDRVRPSGQPPGFPFREGAK
jgi:hypothetical protein